MGRIFSFGEIESRQIPELTDFLELMQFIRQRAEMCLDILGGVFCGSVVRKDYNIRSDLDCLLYYLSGRDTEINECFSAFYSYAYNLHIPLQIIEVDDVTRDWVIDGMKVNSIAYSFGQHIAKSVQRGGVIKQNPMSDIFVGKEPSRAEVAAYLISKLRKTKEGRRKLGILSQADYCHLLQKALEIPIYATRMILFLKGVDLGEGNRHNVETAARSVLRDSEILDCIQQLRELDSGYNAALAECIQGLDRDRYERAVKKLESGLPLVQKFLTTALGLISD